MITRKVTGSYLVGIMTALSLFAACSPFGREQIVSGSLSAEAPPQDTSLSKDRQEQKETFQQGDLFQQEEASRQEDLFQQDVDDLFDTDLFGADSFSWDSTRINGERFDSEHWTDTARIVLVDTVKNMRYVHPFCSCITSNFGPRRWGWHYGVDIKLRKGDSVAVAFDGVVRVIQYDRRGYGHVVVVRHPGGIETIYGHLSKKLTVPKQRVRAGEIIGLGGNTGRSTGSHLHFEVRYRGEPFDPNHMVDFNACALWGDTLILTSSNFEYLVELRKAKWHTVHSGNTLGYIARKYGTSVKKLCQLNNISRKTTLRLGRKIRYQ
jgi:murein DD-endopeptidase MepM/ murein hydrolase activator NlpD